MKPLLLALLGILAQSSAHACSMGVNDLYQKNILVGIAASKLGVDLSKVTKIGITNYSRNFSGASGPSDCPNFINTQEKVTLSYKKGTINSCIASVVVHRSLQIGDEPVADAPYESTSAEAPSVMCTISAILPRS